jgi:23S rRNA G2445 N2-methylase RlmL
VAGAGLEERISIEAGDLSTFETKRGWNAWIVTNPPYGERIGEERDLEPLYRRFGGLLRERCAGYHVAILSGNPALSRALALAPGRRTSLKNGPIDCELLQLEVPV